MNLDFLTVTADDAVARSPMEPVVRAAGARFEVRDGWNVAAAFGASPAGSVGSAGSAGAVGPASGGARVGWADSSHLAKLELQGSSEAIDAAAGTELTFGTAVRRHDAWWGRLTGTRALIVGASPAARERVNAADGVNVLDVTSNFAAITIVGPLAREVFARFCALDLRPAVAPVHALCPGSIGRQPGILIREAEDRYLFLFGWATGEYMWSVVTDAGGHLGGRPIGVDSLSALPADSGEVGVGA
jgi:glycine cleavage system aminomethyltransferase T